MKIRCSSFDPSNPSSHRPPISSPKRIFIGSSSMPSFSGFVWSPAIFFKKPSYSNIEKETVPHSPQCETKTRVPVASHNKTIIYLDCRSSSNLMKLCPGKVPICAIPSFFGHGD
eukprot:TRINITY_DN23130_c1_g1_i2.p1 TRINITY_DN23130_c1_g1~~TRINITY_DN23130_c1_g1_i2.p1  ORF type:complete len:114 (-),score=11.55 TRINITY_DN23130_c1_g1_i2:139-480(-)